MMIVTQEPSRMFTCACCAPAALAPGRRRFLAAAAGLVGAGLAGRASAQTAPAAPPHTSLTPDQALAALLRGNREFLAGEAPPPSNAARRALLARGQAPYAAILGCADSRTPPELLFHAGLGELFVVRNAGNMASPGAIGSLEYAVAALGVPVIMVLGHERCGAAAAAVEVARDDASLPGHLKDMLLPMLPAALAALRAGGADPVEGTVRQNIARTVGRVVEQSPVIGPAVAAGRVKVVGAYYDLDKEEVSLLG
jgi:carbonic anhydrase